MEEAENELEKQRESYYHKEWKRLARGFTKQTKPPGLKYEEKPVQRSIFRL